MNYQSIFYLNINSKKLGKVFQEIRVKEFPLQYASKFA